MNLGKKVMAGVIAMTIGASAALPGLARADSDDWHHRDYHAWHHHDNDADDYNHYPERRPYAPNYAYGQRNLPANGEGMINRRNPNFRWTCDSDGHHCHWARR